MSWLEGCLEQRFETGIHLLWALNELYRDEIAPKKQERVLVTFPRTAHASLCKPSWLDAPSGVLMRAPADVPLSLHWKPALGPRSQTRFGWERMGKPNRQALVPRNRTIDLRVVGTGMRDFVYTARGIRLFFTRDDEFHVTIVAAAIRERLWYRQLKIDPRYHALKLRSADLVVRVPLAHGDSRPRCETTCARLRSVWHHAKWQSLAPTGDKIAGFMTIVSH